MMAEVIAAPAPAYNVDQLFRRSSSGIVAALFVAFLYTLVMWPVVPRDRLLIWLVSIIAITVVRLSHAARYLRGNLMPQEFPAIERRFLILAGLAGFAWGLAGLLFLPANYPLHQIFTLLVLAGHVAATTSTLSYVPRAYRIYVFPVIVPLIVNLLTFGDRIHVTMGVVTILFVLLMLKLSRMIHGYMCEYRNAMQHEQSRSRTMELLADGAPLKQVLTTLALDFEQRNPGVLCSILLLDEAGERLYTGAAPSLPEFFNTAIDGLAIGPNVGCCGTAAFTGKRCVAEDIASHPYWEGAHELAARAGLRACWSQPIVSASGKVLGTFAIYHRQKNRPTIGEIREIENAGKLAEMAIERGHLQNELQLANLVYRNTGEAMIVIDAEDRVLAINPAFSKITGYAPEDIVGRGIDIFHGGSQDQSAYQAMQESIRSVGHWQGEMWNVRKSGERFAEWLTVNTVFTQDGGVHQRVMLISDITEQKQSDELIWKQANYDPLTGLPNRRLFRDRLELEIRKAHRAVLKMAVLFLDLDHFKEVNDTLGHTAGDQLLVDAAWRIVECVRESDTVARLGGDEFIIILSELDDSTSIERVAQSIVQCLAEPFRLGERTAHVSASVGITIYPDDAEDADELLRHADQAMYIAKNGGRNRFSYLSRAAQKAP